MAQIKCSICEGAPRMAVKTCVECQSLLCERHLTAHNQRVNVHHLVDPTVQPDEWQCPEHKEILKYFCKTDRVSICGICSICDKHRGHAMELLDEFADNKKKDLQNCIEKLEKEKQAKEAMIHFTKEYEKVQIVKAEEVEQRAFNQIQIMKDWLVALQSKVNRNIIHMKKKIVRSVIEKNKKFEVQQKNLNNRIRFIKRLSQENNFTFVKRMKDDDSGEIHAGQDNPMNFFMVDEPLISSMVHKRFLQFADDLIKEMLKDTFPKMRKSKITLDVNTAHCNIWIMNDNVTAVHTTKRQKKVIGADRFQSHHVLSKNKFSSENQYWEVEVKGTQCSIGVAYDNIDKKKRKFKIGYNRKSWSLSVDDEGLRVWHNYSDTRIVTDSPVRSFGIFLEYKAGRLSFYQLCDPMKHLHTFTTTFTRPLHAAFYVGNDSWIKILQ